MGSEKQSALDDHLHNSGTNHRCNDYRGAHNSCVWCEENKDARAELSALREEIHTRGVTIDHLSAENSRLKAEVEGGDHLRQRAELALRQQVRDAEVRAEELEAENARMRERISDLVLLWSWGAGGKAGTGFAEKLGGDGDGETWAVKFDPMDPDEGCEFVVRVETGQDGLPILDDTARAALGGRDD